MNKVTSLKSTSIKCGTAILRSDGIVQLNVAESYEVTPEDLTEFTKTIGELTTNQKALILFVPGKFSTVSQEAMSVGNNPEFYTYSKAEAYVIKSLHQRLLGNFYLNVKKPPVPTKMFSNEEEAVKWLHALS